MGTGALTEYVDVAQVSLYVFWIFFAWLIFYIRRSDRREGYPLESDNPRLVANRGGVLIPPPKEYKLPDGESYFAPPEERDEDEIRAERTAAFRGAAYEPTGDNPMADRVGPAAYAKRNDVPEKDIHGETLIQPLRLLTDFSISKGDPDPRGWEMVGSDDEVAGTVTDIWVDIADKDVRFLEIDIGTRSVLTPMPLSSLVKWAKQGKVYAIKAEQFTAVPAIKNPDLITKLEEDMIGGYYAGGRMYANGEGGESLFRIPIYVGGQWK